ncbi:MAG: hypothetical protein ACOCP5_00445 [Halanaerobiaceae bacterium]
MAEKGSVLILVMVVMTVMFLLYSSLIFILINENKIINNNYHRIKAGLGAETALNKAVFLIKEKNQDKESLESISGYLGEVKYEIGEVIIENNDKPQYKITARGYSGNIYEEIKIILSSMD